MPTFALNKIRFIQMKKQFTQFFLKIYVASSCGKHLKCFEWHTEKLFINFVPANREPQKLSQFQHAIKNTLFQSCITESTAVLEKACLIFY